MSFFSKIVRHRYTPYLILIIITLIASWPLLRPGMFLVHDFTHGARIAEMTRAWQDGHFPVRWSQNFGFGYGMPLFQFYGPLPFYAGSLIYWSTGQLLLAVKSLFVLTNIISAVGAYLLGRRLFKSKLAGLITSLAFTFAPYRFLNLYIRGAVSELWGIMALPWIIWSGLKVIDQERWAWLWFIVSLTVLFLSHNISTMIFSPFILAVLCLYFLIKLLQKKAPLHQLIRSFWQLLASGLLAIGLSSFYLLPAYFEKNLTQVEQFILADYFNYQHHFLYIRQFFRDNWGYGGSEPGPDDPISFFLGYGQIVAVALVAAALAWLLLQWLKRKKQNFGLKMILPTGLAGLLGISLWMCLHKSGFIWDNVSLLEFVQFPWRFLGVVMLLTAMLAGWIIAFSQQWLAKKRRACYMLLLIVLIGLLSANSRFIKPEKRLASSQEYFYDDSYLIQKDMSQYLPDYIPTELDSDLPPVADLIENQQLIDGLVFVENEMKNTDKIQVVENKTHYKLIETQNQAKQQLQLALAYYPGWQAQINDQAAEINIDHHGLINVTTPVGQQSLELKFGPTTLRLISDVLSAFCLIVVLAIIVFKFKTGKINYFEKN